MKTTTRSRLNRAATGVLQEWREAPWFVLLVIAVVAFLGPGLLWAIWRAFTNLF